MLERGAAPGRSSAAFFDAVQQAGYQLTDDVNGYRQEGFAPLRPQRSTAAGASERRARVPPPGAAAARTSRCDCRAFVERVVVRAGRAPSACEVVERRRSVVRAGEVILCGGAINSPQLLQLSGVGNAAELEALGVDVVHDLPGVGENLQDHLEVYVQHAAKLPVSMQPALQVAQAAARRPASGSSSGRARRRRTTSRRAGSSASNDDVAYPNLMFHFLPIAVRYDGSAPAGGHGYQLHVGPMYSDARGSVKISSADPRVHPALRFNYLSTDQDRREWVEAIRCARGILGQPAFDALRRRRALTRRRRSRPTSEILDWVARDAETALHPSCTLPDGHRRASVVDPATMRVHGVDGLRVVDASVFPYVHERQHLRAGDDGRREGGRPDPRQHAAAAPPVDFYRHDADQRR